MTQQWDAPPAPLDVWAGARALVPNTDDHDLRHQRGAVRLPWDAGVGLTGELVPAWVCCDPGCAGVEIAEYPLLLNHACCSVTAGRHMAGNAHRRFTGRTHGPYTPYWEPSAE